MAINLGTPIMDEITNGEPGPWRKLILTLSAVIDPLEILIKEWEHVNFS